MGIIFFFTIPGWIIFALLFIAVGFLGLSIDWIASHWLVIGICTIVLSILFIFLVTKKGQRLWGFSVLSVFTGVFALLISYLMELAQLFDSGKVIMAILDAISGGFIILFAFFGASFLVIKQIDEYDQHQRNQQIFWNFLVRTPIMFLPLLLIYLHSL